MSNTSCKHYCSEQHIKKKSPARRSYVEHFNNNVFGTSIVHKTKKTIKHTDIYNAKKNKISNQLILRQNMKSNNDQLICNELFTTASPTILLPLSPPSSSSASSSSSSAIAISFVASSIPMPTKSAPSTSTITGCLCDEMKSHIRQNCKCNNINRIHYQYKMLSSVILQQYPFPNSSSSYSSSSSSSSSPPQQTSPSEIASSKLLQLRRQDDKQNSLIHRKKENNACHHHKINDCNVTKIKYSNYINNNNNTNHNTNININSNNNCSNKNDNYNNNNNNKNNSIVQSCKYYYKIFMKKQSTIFMSTKTTTRAIMNIKLFIIYALLFLFTFRGVMADITAISPFNRTTTTTTTIQTNNTIPSIESSRSGICTSIDIRNEATQMHFLKGCRVIEGFLTISLIERVKETYENYSFPLLTEITDYFLLFRIDGLKSLSKLFPNLSVIRGNSLFNDYAFVIYEMPHMEDIGLKSLTKIVRGNIRIEKNPQLCFVDTLDWSRILNYNTTGNFIRENKLKNECPVCISTAKSESNSHSSDEIPSIKCPPSSVNDQQGLCWNRFTCQKICPAKCGNRSCSDTGECCDDTCIGGCYGSPTNCTVCHGTRDGNKCVEKCPKDRFNYANSRCVDAIECRKIQKPYRMRGIIETLDYPFVPFEGDCSLDCPKQFYVTGESGARFCVKCVGLCRKDCAPININSISAIQSIQGCTRITGSLNIQIRSQGQHNVVKELENALRDLEVIEGSLKIVRSYPIISLSFFKSLKIIRGNVLETDRYAIYIMDNQNLQSLFTQNVTIERGKLFFHFNPKLCYNNIERLRPFVNDLKNSTKFAIEDVAISSNGDKISCNVTLLETTVIRIVETAAVISLKKMQYEDERTLLGYVLFYIVAPYRNVSMYDGRDACGGDGWRVEDVLNDTPENDQVHFIITHLKPFTQYGFYVKTYTIASEPYGGQSPIQYFKTPASKPSPVTDISSGTVTSNSMHIKWGPPKQPNGELTSYIITAEYATQNMELLEKRDYCANGITPEVVDVLEPTVVEPKKPEVLDCHCEGNDNRDELTDEETEHLIAFENEIQNFIYIRRPSFPAQSERRRKRNIYSKLSNSNSSLLTTPFTSGGEHLDDSDEYFYNDQSYTMTDNSTNSNITGSGNSISGITASSSVAITGLLPNKNNVVTSETGVASQLFPIDPKPAVSTTLNISKILIKDEYGYYKYFYSQVNTSVNSFVLSDLKHYTLYKISIIACHSGTDNEIENCSNDVYIHQKTSKIDNADDIKSLSVSKLASSNHSSSSIAVRWPIPESPNGIIVNFLIRYVRWQDGAEHQYQEICVTRKKDDEKEMEYIIPRMDNGNISFHVIAVSLAGQGKSSPIAYVIINDSDTRTHTHIIILVTVVLLIVTGVLICCYYRKKHLVPVSDLKLIASVNPEYISMQYQADEWEVPREKIIQLCELGQGSFGMVYEGIARNLKRDGEEFRCAIKTANENATDRERANFLKEATTMKGFNTHHVVRLLGVVSRGQPTLVVMELMVHGDLKGYLRAHRPEAEDQLQEMYSRDDIEQQQLQPPTLRRILQMAIEIADGMSYLAAKKFVHRDLAARNCMVAEDLTVKIGDFGMTRDVYETDYYRKGTKGLLPVRWMSPESLKDGVFSSSSDVFSYGVVLWEMATLASQPYQGLSNDQVVRYVIDGGVMERPENCPDKLYKMMIKSWQHRPSARPSFLDIVQSLLDDVNANFRQVSFYHSPAGQSLLEQQRNKNIPVDSRTPLRAEEEDFNVEIDDTYLAPNNSNLPHDDDDEPSHSPLSDSSIGLRFINNNNSSTPTTDVALGKSKTNSPTRLNSIQLSQKQKQLQFQQLQPHHINHQQQQERQPFGTVRGRNGNSTLNRGIAIIRNAFFGYGGNNNFGGESREYRKMNNTSIEQEQPPSSQPHQNNQHHQKQQQQQQQQNHILLDEKQKTSKYLPLGNGFIPGTDVISQGDLGAIGGAEPIGSDGSDCVDGAVGGGGGGSGQQQQNAQQDSTTTSSNSNYSNFNKRATNEFKLTSG